MIINFLLIFRNLHYFNLTFITTVKIVKFISVDHVFLNVQLIENIVQDSRFFAGQNLTGQNFQLDIRLKTQ